MDLLRRSSAGELAELFGERALAADRGQRPFGYRELAQRLLATLPAEQNEWLDAYTEASTPASPIWARARPSTGSPARAPRPWAARGQPARRADVLHDAVEQRLVRARARRHARRAAAVVVRVPDAVDFALRSSGAREHRRAIRPAATCRCRFRALTSSISRRQRAPARGGAPRIEPPLIGPASNSWAVDATRGDGGRAIVANDPHLSLRLPNIFYRIELEWPERAARGVSIPGLARRADRRQRRRRVGRDGQQRRSERLGRHRGRSRRSRIATDARRLRGVRRRARPRSPSRAAAPERVETRVDALGPRRRRGLARPAARAARDLARAARARPRHRRARERHGRRERERAARALGRAVAELGARRPRRRDRAGSSTARCRAASASTARGPSRWPTAAARGKAGSRRRARSAAATACCSRPTTARCRRDARDAVSRMWMRPLRAKRIDELLAAQPHVRRARLPRDAARHARRRLRADSRDDPRRRRGRRARAAARSERASSRAPGTATPTSIKPAFRILHAYYRALLERTLEPLLAPAIAADPNFVYRWPLADEVLRRLLDERPAHLVTSEHADWPAFLRAVLRRNAGGPDATPRRSTPRGAKSTCSTWRIRSRRRWGRSRGGWRCRAAPLPGSMVSLRVAAPSYGAVLRMAVAPAAPGDGVLRARGRAKRPFLVAAVSRSAKPTGSTARRRRSSPATPSASSCSCLESLRALLFEDALLDRRPLRVVEVRMHGPDLVADGRRRRRLTDEHGNTGALRSRPIVVARERDEPRLRRRCCSSRRGGRPPPRRCRLDRRRAGRR